MAKEHTVIIGNGPAANQAAITLRKNSRNHRITLVGRELDPFYRPHKLPDFIAGKIPESDLFVYPLDFYAENGIKLRLGQRVVGVDFTDRWVVLDHNEMIHFTGLIIACGGRPKIPEPLQVFRDLMLTLKTLQDARLWMERLDGVDTVLLLGGDLVSLSVANALVSMGKRVLFILDEECFWPVRFTPEICIEASENLRRKGIEIISGSRVTRVSRNSDGMIEVQTDLQTVKAGIFGVFFGFVPDVRFLTTTGLDIERGILVDEHLRTRFEGVYAAGDCAQVYHPQLRDYWVSIGYENALNLGKTAALNLLGGKLSAVRSPESIFPVDDISINTSWWMEF
jgi:NADPH-dependent 2,4-dienoyl-CoA reductase/sulfur reductase-like enzyme